MKLNYFKVLGISALTFLSMNSIAQDLSEREKHQEFSVSLGKSFTSFQDVKFSNVRYNGNGINVKLNYQRETNQSIINAGINFTRSTEKPSTYKVSGQRAVSSLLYPRAYASYLKKHNSNFSYGARLDILDFYYRTTQGLLLGNNALYLNSGTHLALKGQYNRALNDNFEIVAGLEYGLFSWMRESTSFAFSAPQEALESGQFNYQDPALNSPFGFKYYQLMGFWSLVDIRTNIGLKFKKRWTLNYDWQLRRRSIVKGYPTTFGVHTISLKFDILDRVKTKRK